MKFPINKQLLGIHRILTYIKDQTPSILGHGKLGTGEIHYVWRDFITTWQSQEKPELYFVKTDIIHCYDTIRQDKLSSILDKLLRMVRIYKRSYYIFTTLLFDLRKLRFGRYIGITLSKCLVSVTPFSVIKYK